jgi:hypothetical protein
MRDVLQKAGAEFISQGVRRSAPPVEDMEVARGEGVEITQVSMRQLVEDVSRRGRERLAAKQAVHNGAYLF